MINTLKKTIPFLTDWLLKLKKTKSTSEVGLTDSTGNGKSKNETPDWTTIIIFLVFGIAMWLVPSPLSNRIESIQTVPVPVVSSTHVDTLWRPYTVYIGGDSTTNVQHIKVPTLVELVTDKEEPNAHIYIRSTAYPYLQNDSLFIDLVHEYNIQPKGMEIIRIDSIPYPVPVEVPAKVPFIEQPLVVATGTLAITLGIVYIVGQALK